MDGASKKVAVLKSANMSLGINMLMELLKQAATILAPAGFDMEIVENTTTRNWMRRAVRHLHLPIL